MDDILTILETHATYQGHNPAFIMATQPTMALSYQEVIEKSQTIAAYLIEHYPKQSRVILLMDNCLDFFISFLGCLYANMIAVPLAPPNPNRHRLPAEIKKLEWVYANCEPQAIITLPFIQSILRQAKVLFSTQDNQHVPLPLSLPTHTINEMHPVSALSRPKIKQTDVAFLQYTSGSTGPPKGVMISHHNIITNAHAIARAAQGIGSFVTWIPTFHDMGIMNALFVPLVKGLPSYVLSPLEFLSQPVTWLQALTTAPNCGTTTPNFAFEWCCQKITNEQLMDINLSGWQKVVCGAEKNQMDSFLRFTDRFSPLGFRPEILSPCYGLAEHTLCVSGYSMQQHKMPEALTLSHHALSKNRATDATKEQPAVTFFNHGKALKDHKIRIISTEDKSICDDNTIGEIWCQGPSVAMGYWNNDKDTKRIFQAYTNTGEGPFLRTGDLGFLRDNQLYITGRIKNVLIIRGQNYSAEDIEWVAQQAHPAIRGGSLCAFNDDLSSQNASFLLIELRPNILPTIKSLNSAIQQRLNLELGIKMENILLLPPHSLCKTTSGKMQRQLNKQNHQHKKIPILATIKHNTISLHAKKENLQTYFTLTQEEP